MMDSVIELKHVNFAYEAGNDVLRDVSLRIDRGDYVGIIGGNGSAKSTLLKLMVGILRSDRGQIKLMEKEIGEFDEWRRIGYLSQKVRDFNTNFPATVEEIVGANFYSKKKFLKFLTKDDRRKIKQALNDVGMEEFGDRLIGSLSGGQQQKVFIARLLINDPEILFMDEPLVGMDLKSQESFYHVLHELNKKRNTTIVMVTHDIRGIFQRASKVIFLGENTADVYGNIGDMNREEKVGILSEKMKILV